MDRRVFLTATALGLMSGCSSFWTRGHSGSSTMKLKKCLKIGMVNIEGSLLEKFKVLKEVGFDGVEMDSPSGVDWDEVRSASLESGLEIPGIVCSTHWGKPLSANDPAERKGGIDGVKQALRDCKKVEGTTVLLVPGVCSDSVSYQQAWERSTAAVRELIPLATELGVQIAFENVWNNFITNADEAVRYVDQFESPAVGWYFDTGNIVRYQKPVEWVEKLAHRIIKLDIKDYSKELMESEGIWAGFRCKIGDPQSSVDWAGTMEALRRVGYQGWGSAEVSGGNRDRLADISRRMDDVFSR